MNWPSIKNLDVVELERGTSTILKLAKLKQISNCGFTAGEFTKSGIDCINLIAAFEEIKVQAGFCDLKSLNLRKFSIPKIRFYLLDNGVFERFF